MTWRVIGLALALVVALAAWVVVRDGDAREGDFKQELADLARDLRGRVDPLPQVQPPQTVTYGAAQLPDPFYPPATR